jgi:membrane protein implicated in regulation of membrane protease activity
VKVWTAHTAPGRTPELVREGFSWGAFLFGPVWLVASGAWIFGLIVLAAELALGLFAPVWTLGIAAFVVGVFGYDLCRLALELRGYVVVHVIAASSFDLALARLLARRPDLSADIMG